jgi:cytochrome bd-type quinol oxidase subunit 2
MSEPLTVIPPLNQFMISLPKEQTSHKSSKTSKITLLLGILVAIFWITAKNSDVYDNALKGAIFEILWLPMLAALLILPLISLILWRKEKFSARSLYLYTFLIVGAAAMIAVFMK